MERALLEAVQVYSGLEKVSQDYWPEIVLPRSARGEPAIAWSSHDFVDRVIGAIPPGRRPSTWRNRLRTGSRIQHTLAAGWASKVSNSGSADLGLMEEPLDRESLPRRRGFPVFREGWSFRPSLSCSAAIRGYPTPTWTLSSHRPVPFAIAEILRQASNRHDVP